MFEAQHIIYCEPKEDYQLFLRFADGAEGTVDLSHLVGKGVFSRWSDINSFREVAIDPVAHTVCWGKDIDLDPFVLRENTIIE